MSQKTWVTIIKMDINEPDFPISPVLQVCPPASSSRSPLHSKALCWTWDVQEIPVQRAPALTPIKHARQTPTKFPFKKTVYIKRQAPGICSRKGYMLLPALLYLHLVAPATNAIFSLFFLDPYHDVGSEKSSLCCYLFNHFTWTLSAWIWPGFSILWGKKK